MSRGIDRKSGGGALEPGDLRLLEDGSERGGAHGPDVIALQTARERCEVGGYSERTGVSS